MYCLSEKQMRRGNVKMKKKQLAMLALLAILAVLLAVTIWMPGTAGEEPSAYATIFSCCRR